MASANRCALRSWARWNSVLRAERSSEVSAETLWRISVRARRLRAGMMKNPSVATNPAIMKPVTSAAAVVAASVTIAPSPSAPALTAAAAATALRAPSAIRLASRRRS